MKFLMFIDRVYSKIIIAYCVLTIPFLLCSVYLYKKLPIFIPSKIGIMGVYSFLNKEFIFVLPVLFLIVGLLFSRKGIIEQFNNGSPRLFMQCFGLIILLLVLCSCVALYFRYFTMI